MRQDYLEKIKEENSWFWDRKDEVMYLIITDDLDSLFSALLILMYRPNWEIGGFFDYREGLYKKLDEDIELTQDNTIWVDCSSIIQSDKCISNHLTSISGEVHNSCDINLNTIDGNNRDKDYFSKYNLSTFLLLTSLFQHKIDNRVGRILSLCFDSSFKAYYQPVKYADSRVQKRYLNNVLELHDIYDVQLDMAKKEFSNIQLDQNLNSKIYVDTEGIRTFEQVDLEMLCKYLNINTSLECLNGIYAMIEKSTCTNMNISEIRDIDLQNTYITSFAITSNNNVSFSYKVD